MSPGELGLLCYMAIAGSCSVLASNIATFPEIPYSDSEIKINK